MQCKLCRQGPEGHTNADLIDFLKSGCEAKGDVRCDAEMAVGDEAQVENWSGGITTEQRVTVARNRLKAATTHSTKGPEVAGQGLEAQEEELTREVAVQGKIATAKRQLEVALEGSRQAQARTSATQNLAAEVARDGDGTLTRCERLRKARRRLNDLVSATTKRAAAAALLDGGEQDDLVRQDAKRLRIARAGLDDAKRRPSQHAEVGTMAHNSHTGTGDGVGTDPGTNLVEVVTNRNQEPSEVQDGAAVGLTAPLLNVDLDGGYSDPGWASYDEMDDWFRDSWEVEQQHAREATPVGGSRPCSSTELGVPVVVQHAGACEATLSLGLGIWQGGAAPDDGDKGGVGPPEVDALPQAFGLEARGGTDPSPRTADSATGVWPGGRLELGHAQGGIGPPRAVTQGGVDPTVGVSSGATAEEAGNASCAGGVRGGQHLEGGTGPRDSICEHGAVGQCDRCRTGNGAELPGQDGSKTGNGFLAIDDSCKTTCGHGTGPAGAVSAVGMGEPACTVEDAGPDISSELRCNIAKRRRLATDAKFQRLQLANFEDLLLCDVYWLRDELAKRANLIPIQSEDALRLLEGIVHPVLADGASIDTTIWEAAPAGGGLASMAEQVSLKLESLPDDDGADKEDCEAADLESAAPDAALEAEHVGVKAVVEACDRVEHGSLPADAASAASAENSSKKFSGEECSSTRRPSGSSVRHQRFRTKRKPCQRCSGPCREGHCTHSQAQYEATAPAAELAKHDTSELAEDHGESDGNVADTFMEVVRRMREQRAAADTTAAATTDSSSRPSEGPSATRKRGPPVTAGMADCRKRRKEQAQLPRNFGELPTWLQVRPKVGGVSIDSSHTPHLAWHRGITWCWICGTFALEVPNKLRVACEPPTVAGARQLVRLRLGLTPRNSVGWPVDAALTELDGDQEELNS